MQNIEAGVLKGYKLEERIGVGGFGAVYRARQTTIDREVAIKIILPNLANNPDFIRRFESEAHTIARLEHPHITPLIDYWRDPEGAYLVMRYLRGGSLRQALQNGPYDLIAASQTLDQIATALDFAHRNKVIHRDIKPGNILMDEDNNAYLADFGIAKDLTQNNDGLTGVDAMVGSLDYISPEQARSEPVTARTDIYSLGVTLYEMITGEHPFKQFSSIERLYKHINDPLPDIDNLSDDVCDAVNEVIQKATAKNPENRYAEALLLAIAFRQAIGRDNNQENDVIQQLTLREHEILGMVAKGMSNREIANILFVTVGTVKWHIRQIYGKLGVRSRVQAIVRARELNLIVTGDTTAEAYTMMDDGSLLSISLPEPENPYKGLHAFQPIDAHDFFGREELTQKLIDRLREKQNFNRFLAVVGPSGSGKSSVVKAGLIPALWRGALPGSDKWFIADMIPGAYPLDKLETALIRVAANQTGVLREQLQRDERGLLRVADIILPADDTELVIVIDQFEEVFTLIEDETDRQHFLNLIQSAVSDSRSRIRIIVTLRADYYDRPLHYPEFGELIRSRIETVLPLSVKGLERAIRGPAERVGVAFEQGLVEQIVSTMNYQTGALPLLQYALTELFDRRQGRLLTNEAYQAIGGAVGALANRADEIYLSLTPESKALTQQMFMRLVTLGEGAEDTRRRVLQSELLSLTDNTDLMEEIIDQFSAYRLLSLDHDHQTRLPTVEVAHEAILREWERLRTWINDGRAQLRMQNQLTGLTADWHKAKEEKSYLLRGARLEEFEAWQKTTTISLTSEEKRYLQTSLDIRAQDHTEEEVRQAREAHLEKRGQRLLQIAVGVFAVATVVALMLAIFAFDREQQTQDALSLAERESKVNRSLVLANDALFIYDLGQTDAALLIAMEAISIDDPPQDAIRAFADVARDIGTRGLLQGHVYAVRELAISPDNRLLASGSCAILNEEVCEQGQIILWDLQTLAEMARFDVQEKGWVTGLSFSPESDRLASSHENGVIVLWDIADGKQLNQFNLSQGAIYALVYHTQFNQIASASADGNVYLLDDQMGDVMQTFSGHEGAVNALAFNPDGSELLTGGADGLVMLWDVATGERISTFEQGPDKSVPIAQVVFDMAHNWIVAANTERHVWDKDTGELIYVSGNTLRTHGLALTADGMAYEGMGQFVRLEHPNQDGSTVSARVFYDHNAIVYVLSISSDDRWLVTGASDGIVRVWNLNAQRAQRIPVMTSVSRIRLSPDQTKLIVGGFDRGSAYLYDYPGGTLLHELKGDFPIAWALEFSPDGRYVAIGFINFFNNDADSALTLWDVATGEKIRIFEGHTIRVSDFSFTSDGNYLLSSSQNFAEEGELILWEVATGELVRRFDHDENIANVMITGDDRFALTTAYFGQYMSVWDLNTGEMLRRRDFDANIEFSRLGAKGQTALIGLNDGRLLEVDMETLTTRRSFDGHTGSIWDIALSEDNTLMVSGQTKGIVIIWDYVTGRELDRLEHPGGFQTNVAFGPDGKTVLTSAYLNDVIEWYASYQSLDELIDWVNDNRYIRELTCDERVMYQIEPYCEG